MLQWSKHLPGLEISREIKSRIKTTVAFLVIERHLACGIEYECALSLNSPVIGQEKEVNRNPNGI